MRMQAFLLVAVTSMTANAAAAQESPALAQELERLRGSFVMISGTADGTDMPAEMTGGMKRVARDMTTTVTMNGALYFKAAFSINPSASPKTIDYDMTEGFTAGKKQLGVYRTSGDTVTFCFGSPDKSRPTDFASKPGGGVTCSTWKREKPNG